MRSIQLNAINCSAPLIDTIWIFPNYQRIEQSKSLEHDEHNSIVVKELATELGNAFGYLLQQWILHVT